MLNNDFKYKIRDIRGDRTVSEVADIVGVSRRTWRKYENGEAEPCFEILYDICKKFDVSADFLLGLTKCKCEECEHLKCVNLKGRGSIFYCETDMKWVKIGIDHVPYKRPEICCKEW